MIPVGYQQDASRIPIGQQQDGSRIPAYNVTEIFCPLKARCQNDGFPNSEEEYLEKSYSEVNVGDFANKLRCYKKQVWIQDISDRLVLLRTKKGQVDLGSTLTNQCSSSSPVGHLTNFSVSSLQLCTTVPVHCSYVPLPLYTAATYHCPCALQLCTTVPVHCSYVPLSRNS